MTGRASAEHHGDDAPPIEFCGGEHVEARRADVAGLDSVHVLQPAEQAVVVAQHATAHAMLGLAEVGELAREAILDRAAENRQIAGGRHLLRIGQARGVAEHRARHAQRLGLAGHQAREILLIARNRLCDRNRDVIGRLCNERANSVLDRDGGARAQTDLGGRLGGGVRRNRDLAVEAEPSALQLLEQQVERHHLRDRGGMAQRVLVGGVQDAARVRINHERSIGRRVGGGALLLAGACVGRRQHSAENESHCDAGDYAQDAGSGESDAAHNHHKPSGDPSVPITRSRGGRSKSLRDDRAAGLPLG